MVAAVAVVAESRRTSPFVQYLQSVMDERGLNPSQIATYANVSRTTVIYWLRGSAPQRESLEKLADGLGVPYEMLRDLAEGRDVEGSVREEAERTIRLDDPEKAPHLRILSRLSAETLDFLARMGAAAERDRQRAREKRRRSSS